MLGKKIYTLTPRRWGTRTWPFYLRRRRTRTTKYKKRRKTNG